MGSRAPSTTVVQPPAPQVIERPLQPVPSQTTQETARQVAQARLEFDPQLAQQQFELLQRFYRPTAELQAQTQIGLAPQLGRAEATLAGELTPLYRAIYEQAFPAQTRGLETLASQALQRLESPESLTPAQLSLQEASRERAREQIRRSVRQGAELGGTLFGGRRQEAETEALSRYEQGLLESDLERAMRQRAQALQELITAQQVVFPQIQQPGVPGGFVPPFQTAAPSADALLQAIIAQSQGAIFNPAMVGFGPSPATRNIAGFNAFGNVLQGFGPFVR